MTWALKARRYWVIIVVAIVASVVGTTAGNVDLPIPFLSSLLGPSSMPAAVIPSLVLAVVAGAMIQSAELFWTATSVRNVVAHSMVSAVGIIAVVVLASILTGTFVHDYASAWLLVRDVVGFLLFWSSARALGARRLAGLVPVVYLLLASAFARNSVGEVRGWAWILERNLGNPWAIATLVLGSLLTVIYVLRQRPLIGRTTSARD